MPDHASNPGIPPILPSSYGAEVEVALDEQGLIEQDIDCRKCAYNLRGLSPETRCPECGTSVGWSIHGDFLRYSDPVWVKQLAKGAWWLIISAFVFIFAKVVGGVIDSLLGNDIVSNFMGILQSMIGLVGIWKITMPDPGKPVQSSPWNVRRLTRGMAFAGFFGLVIAFFLSDAASSMSLAVTVTLAIVTGFLMLAGVIGTLLMFLLMRRIALRIPDDRLAQRTKVVMIGFVTCSGLFVGVILAAIVFSVSSFGTAITSASVEGIPALLLLICGCGALIGLLVFGIWWIILLFGYRRALDTAAATALRTWMRYSGSSSTAPLRDD